MRRLALLLALLLIPLAATAEKRLGLVIGNDGYAEVPRLEKARADDEAVAEALIAQGFDMIVALDADRRLMNQRIAEFTGQLQPGDTAFVFFAGHGVEIDGENYLLPTDIVAPASGQRDFIKSESIALSALLDRVRATGARTTLAVIDACRNNPFATATGRSIGTARGLGRITAPQGTFVIFSAGAGQLALDRLSDEDEAANSVFTRKLLPRLSEPGLELRPLVAGLRQDVRDLARGIGHDQFPAYYDELLGPFYFAPPGTAIPAHAPTVTKADPMRADFDLAREMNTVAAYDAFIERYGEKKGEFTVQMAMQLRDNLSAKPAEAPTPPRETPPAVLPQDGTRETIRRTQEALNAAGCEAGVADGVIGRRTRAAFARFAGLAGKNKSLQLGSAAALAAMQEDIRNGVKCETVAAPAPAPDGPTEAPAFTLAGTWHFTAKCPLFVTTTGTIRLRSQGGGRFVGTMRDSLGQTANISSLLNGRDFTSTEAFPNLQAKSWGQLSADGRRYSATTSVGCKVHARKG